MSDLGWSFVSFDLAALERLFAKPSAAEGAALRAVDREVAERTLGKGRLSYDAFAQRERVRVDRFINDLLADEGVLGAALSRRAETRDPLLLEDAAALADAADLDPGGHLLRLLIAGRRLGLPDLPMGGTYVVYAPEEIGDLLYALRTALGKEALDKTATAAVRKDVLPVLERVSAHGRALFASLPVDEVEELDRLASAGETGKLTPGSAQQARHQLLVQGDVDAALATLAGLVDRCGPTERERTLGELVDLCARYGRLDEAKVWHAKLAR